MKQSQKIFFVLIERSFRTPERLRQAVTPTAATRADPAFGRRGVSFTVLAVTDVEVPPPLESPPDVGATSTVTAAELFARLLSGADVFVISAFMT